MVSGLASDLASHLVGKVVSGVRALSEQEVRNLAWSCPVGDTCVVEFVGGVYLVVMCDPEGNGPGFLEVGSYLSHEDDDER